MRDPRWAVMLTGALLVAGCAASADDAALAPAPMSSGADNAVALAYVPQLPIKDMQVHALAAMSGPFAEDGTMGEGCSPQEGESLADGSWFGFVIDYSPTSITVDVACVYGPETEQYSAFSQAEDSDTHHYVVVNDVVAERSVRLSEATEVYIADLDWEPTDPSAARHALDPEVVQEHRGLWVTVQDGRATTVVEPAPEVPLSP